MKFPSDAAAVLRDVWGDEKKRTGLLVAGGILGMLLIGVSEWIPEPADAAPDVQTSDTAYVCELEERLCELISQMDGAGQTRVMVTLESDQETVYAKDTETSTTETQQTSRSSHVLTSGNSEGLVETVQEPQVRGVAVLCEGGDQPGIQLRITELVSVLTGAGANHITVNKLQT